MDEKEKLYIEQVKTLNTFLHTGAITKLQYEKSFGDLTKKMFPDGDAPQVPKE